MARKAFAPQSRAQVVDVEQLKHAAEAARRATFARDRVIGALVWCAISFVLPAQWKWFGWLAACIGLLLACWNWEQSLIERRLSTIGLSPEDFA